MEDRAEGVTGLTDVVPLVGVGVLGLVSVAIDVNVISVCSVVVMSDREDEVAVPVGMEEVLPGTE